MNDTDTYGFKALAKAFVGDLEPEQAARLMDEAKSDAALRASFNTLALADRGLHGEDSPSEFEHRFRDAQVLSALDGLLEEEDQGAEVLELNPASSVAKAGAWIAAAAACALVLWPVFDGVDAPDEFQARGVATDSSNLYERPELVVHCVEETDGQLQFKGPRAYDLDIVQCPKDAQIKLAYQSSDPRLKWASFVGVSDSGKLLWYGPTPVATDSVAVRESSELVPVGETIRLRVNHEEGEVRVYGIFSESPMDFGETSKWAGESHTGNELAGAPDRAILTSTVFEVVRDSQVVPGAPRDTHPQGTP